MFQNIILIFAVLLLTISSINCNTIRLRRDTDPHATDRVCDTSILANPVLDGSSPYEITATSSDYESESSITVTITGDGENQFKGFLVKAIDVATNEPIGTWTEIPDESRFVAYCAATIQTNYKNKEQMVLVWNAPANKQGQVKFVTTIVKSLKIYWKDLVAEVKK